MTGESSNKRRREERINDAEGARDDALQNLDNNQYVETVQRIVNETLPLGGIYFNNAIDNDFTVDELLLLEDGWHQSKATKAPDVAKLIGPHFNPDYATLVLIHEDVTKALKVVNAHFESLYLKEFLTGMQINNGGFQKLLENKILAKQEEEQKRQEEEQKRQEEERQKERMRKEMEAEVKAKYEADLRAKIELEFRQQMASNQNGYAPTNSNVQISPAVASSARADLQSAQYQDMEIDNDNGL
eukprot:s43_g35.t1